ncbi:MAG: NAD(P)-dependent oxidoreductase [Candidatus Omnitrophica bacterium]|nr:NAD(P)-dependent oxidoreductase [Candidatus Omnitrophota bacterium]
MRLLIDGVPGWLGNRFLELLASHKTEKNYSLRCLAMQGTDVSWMKKIPALQDIEIFYGDVTQPSTLDKAFEDVDVFFHLVGLIHPRKIQELYQVNLQGTLNVLEAAQRKGVKRFIHVSSNSVAGIRRDPAQLMKESDPPQPYMHYGKSKWMAEKTVLEHQQKGRFETVILRPCWYYGPNQPARQSAFFHMIKKGNPIIFGNGNNLRSMTYLDNLCEAMILVAESSRAVGQTYWIADEQPYSTKEIYETIADLLEVKNYRPRYVPGLTSEVMKAADALVQSLGLYIKEVHVAGEMNKNIACSIEKAKRELGYKPTIALREGMRRSIEWCRQHGASI